MSSVLACKSIKLDRYLFWFDNTVALNIMISTCLIELIQLCIDRNYCQRVWCKLVVQTANWCQLQIIASANWCKLTNYYQYDWCKLPINFYVPNQFGAAIVPCKCLHLQSCGPGFKSQAHYLHFFRVKYCTVCA